MRETVRAVGLVVMVAAAGALAALGVGALMGMSAGDLVHLLVPLAVSTTVTVATAVAANAVLAKTSLRYRFLVVAVLGAGVGIGRIGGSATEGIARQPDATARIQTAMIIAAALIEGVALFVAVIGFLIQSKITF